MEAYSFSAIKLLREIPLKGKFPSAASEGKSSIAYGYISL